MCLNRMLTPAARGATDCGHYSRTQLARGRSATLGLVAGSSPIGAYQELVKIHAEHGLDLSNVSIFIVNEYYGVEPDRLQSLRRWLLENFVNKTNVRVENVHFFESNLEPKLLESYCRRYEEEINLAGGIDVLLLELRATAQSLQRTLYV